MSNVITAREAEELVRKGEAPPAGAILTPSARDVFGGKAKPAFKVGAAAGSAGATAKKSTGPSIPDYEFRWTPGTDAKTPAEIEKFFKSPAIQILKERI